MTELTVEQVDGLYNEIASDPEYDCSVFGPWVETQKKERGSDDSTLIKIWHELELRRRQALVNLALRRYCSHD